MSERESLYKAPLPNTLLLREIKHDTEAPCSPMVKESGIAGGSSHLYSQYAWKSRDSTSINNYSNKLQNFYWLNRIKVDSHTFKFQMLLLSRFSRVRLLQPHRRQPTRLPCPWNSPGKNTSGLPFPSPMHESKK